MRHEDICLTCKRPAKQCFGGSKGCPFDAAYPNWKTHSPSSLRQDACGVNEQPDTVAELNGARHEINRAAKRILRSGNWRLEVE